ncbi:RICIN domain-containing protein [Streptomyces sp. NPDC057654]|uniref:RICIN domain-containing protein n=1 Tax=Streptomyces sp. NPDC057654 TaxID=3346196 RepID=UPI0036782B74
MAAGTAVLAAVAVLLASGSRHKPENHQVTMADVPRASTPASLRSSPSPQHSPSPSSSPSLKHHTTKPTATTGQSAGHGSAPAEHSPSPSAKRHTTKPTATAGQGAGHGSAPAKNSPKKSAQAGHPSAPAVSQLFGGSAQVLLHNRATGLCANLPGYGKGSVNGPVNEYHCRAGGSDNQMWNLKPVHRKGPGEVNLFVIRNIKDGLCMDLPGYAAKPVGAKVSEYRCDESARDNQTWYIWPGHDNHYQIRNGKSGGRCLGVSGGPGAGLDARLELRSCGTADTDWSW